MICESCGNILRSGTEVCDKCGAAQPITVPAHAASSSRNKDGSTNVTVNLQGGYVQQAPRNNLAIAGFVLALVALFVSPIPGLDWVVWILGAVFSVIGLRKQPRGLAIAGTAISFAGLILLLFAMSACAAVVGSLSM